MQPDNLERVYVDMGEGRVMGGSILRRYTWGALVQCGFQCFKISDNCIFKTLVDAREAAVKSRRQQRWEAARVK